MVGKRRVVLSLLLRAGVQLVRASGPAILCCTIVALSYAAEPSSAATAESSKMVFPDGAATPSEVCGVCHKATYKEFTQGTGADLHWGAMKLVPSSTALMELDKKSSPSATAHHIAGSDPWPIQARGFERAPNECNVCHFPEAFSYPDAAVAKIERPALRAANRESGITCASCHVTPEGKIRGPYVVDAPHETVVDPRIQTSVACAYCHSDGTRIVGKQTQTFLEWRDDFKNAGLGQQQCQDCHMPKTVRKLAEDFPVPDRVVSRHTWPGGHSFQRLASALSLAITQSKEGASRLTFHVTNIGAGHSVPTGSNRRAVYLTAEVLSAKGDIVASNDWMFAPWMLGRPDDKKHVEEDLKGPNPIATSQADMQGPHATIIRAGEDRVLDWIPSLPAGEYAVRATLTYDLNRYNDRAFKGDQFEIGKATLGIKVSAGSDVVAEERASPQ